MDICLNMCMSMCANIFASARMTVHGHMLRMLMCPCMNMWMCSLLCAVRRCALALCCAELCMCACTRVCWPTQIEYSRWCGLVWGLLP